MAGMKSMAAPERTYGIVLWVLSVVFAAFIIGLGNLVIGDLPQVEDPVHVGQFVESQQSAALKTELAQIAERRGAIDGKLDIARLQLEQAQKASQTGTETFQAWIQTRTACPSAQRLVWRPRPATPNPQRAPEVIERTRQLEQLKANERALQASIAELENERLPLQQRENDLQNRQFELERQSQPELERAMFWQEMRIFAFRLLITLPMLLIAAWLVVKKRKSDHWPLIDRKSVV